MGWKPRSCLGFRVVSLGILKQKSFGGAIHQALSLYTIGASAVKQGSYSTPGFAGVGGSGRIEGGRRMEKVEEERRRME